VKKAKRTSQGSLSNKKISLEMHHILADGYGAVVFLKALLSIIFH
jgi:NRPS condensation-like uncharacterized protein